MLLGYSSGAHALLTSTLFAKTPTRAAIVGTDGTDRDRRRLLPAELVHADPARRASRAASSVPHTGGGLRHQADEVARCLREGLTESPVMPLDESVAIMSTMDDVRAGAAAS